MGNIIKELKEEYIGDEIRLLEFDKNMQAVAEDTELIYADIFDSNNIKNIEEGSFCFLYKYYISTGWIESVNIIFDVVGKTDDILDTVIKVTDVELI